MASTATLKFLLLAEDQASRALKTVGGETEKTGQKIHGMSTGAKVALAGVGVAAVGFAKSSIDKFQEVTGESLKLRRALGGTVEDASRWRFAAEESGVSTEGFTLSMQKFDKNLVAANSTQKSAAALTKRLGFSFRDAHGHILPMNDLLPKLSDKFAKMPNGPEKTALAMKLFGKSGSEMLPFLDKGSSKLEDFRKESDKFGLTVGEKNVKDLIKARAAQREWHASLDGLKMQVGAQLLPILNQFMAFVRDHIIPIIEKVTGFVKDHKQAVMLAVVVIGTLIIGLKAWAIAQGILNTVMALNPIALIVIAIAALVAGVIYIATKTQIFQKVWHAAWGAVKAAFFAVWNFIKDHWRLILIILTGPIGAAVVFIKDHWTAIKDGFMSVVHFIGDKVSAIVRFITSIPGRIAGVVGKIAHIGGQIGAGLWNGIKGIIGDVGGFGKTLYNAVAQSINWLIDKIKNWHFTIGAFGVHHTFKPFGGIPEIPLLAKGGIVNSPTLAMIGEAGPEAVVPLNRAKNFGFGGGITVIVNVDGQPLVTKADIGRAVLQAAEFAVNQGATANISRGIR